MDNPPRPPRDERGPSRRLWAALASCGALVGLTTPAQLRLFADVPWWPTVLLGAAVLGFVCLLLFFFDRTVDDGAARPLVSQRVSMILVPAGIVTVLLFPSSFPFWMTALIGLSAGCVLSVSFIGAIHYLQFAASSYGALSIAVSSLTVGLVTFVMSYLAVSHPLWVSVPAGLVTSTLSLFVLLRVCRFLPSLGRRQWGNGSVPSGW